MNNKDKAKKDWVKWLNGYGIEKFYDAFVAYAQDSRSKCKNCGQSIYLDIVEGGGIPDWKTVDGDYGCEYSPDTCKDGCGSHVSEKI